MDYEQFAANLRGEIPKLKTQELEKTKAATEPIGYSNQEAFYAGLLGLAPLLAGVIKGGKKNIAAGAEAGLLGTQLFGSDKKEKDKEAKTRLAAEAQLLTDERKGKEKSLAAFEQAGAIEELKQENRLEKERLFPRKGLTVNVGPDKPLSDAMTDKLLQPLGIIQAAQGAIDFTKQKAGPNLKKYTNPDGSVDWDGAAGIIGDSLKQAVGGGDTNRGEIQLAWERFAQQYKFLISGAAATDKEFDKLYAESTGASGLLPPSIPTALKIMERVQKEQEMVVRLRNKAIDIAKTPNAEQRTSLLDQLLKDVKTSGLDVDRVAEMAFSNSNTSASKGQLVGTAPDGRPIYQRAQ